MVSAFLLGLGCAPASRVPTTTEKLSAVQKRLGVVRSDPQQAAAVFAALRESFEKDKENWQETSCYAIAVFVCPVEAAAEYVSFVCFLADNDVDCAAHNLSALRVVFDAQAEDGEGLLDYLKKNKQGNGYEDAWAATRGKLAIVKPSPVHEFVFVLDS